MGHGRNLEVHHKKDLRKMKWNFRWRLLENEDKMKPIQGRAMETKPVLKTRKKDGMIDSIKGSRQIFKNR